MKLLTFDVGGTEIKYAIIEGALSISDKGYIPTPLDSFDSFVNVVKEINMPYKGTVDGIAMCLPGTVDVLNGQCSMCSAMKYPHSVEVGHLLSEVCGCKVVLENDGKAAALAEYEYGSIQGCQEQSVLSPEDLLMRIVSEEDYKEKWDKWCDAMQAEIIRNRK